ncbi:MAG: ABC transporter substrate-binding protein [Bacteroidetes bacterium]|nr:ABC transporter substrate-binding protein [Bacteroidota bacterium]
MKIRIGGVPEHFNHPWQIAIQNGSFSNIGVDVDWQYVPGGTGAMTQMLRNGELDLAIVLTEGIVADIAQGNPSLIVQKYVKSPLIWGIHAASGSTHQQLPNPADARFAISRKGSGSHIMATVWAREYGVELNDSQLIETGNFDSAVEAMQAGKADLLLWEKFTTLPSVKSGVLKRLGETVTPWPCFVIAARQEMLLKHPERIWNMLWVLRKTCRHFMHDNQSPFLIAEHYNLAIDEARMWFNQTEWEQDIYLSRKMLNNVVNTLYDINLINWKPAPEELCWNRAMVY